MASLLDKVQTYINASLHSIVDRALEQNSVAVMDEYIRQAERDLDELEDATANVGGTVRTLKRKYEEFSAAAEKLDRDIDTLVLKGKDDLAAAAQSELNTKQRIAQEHYEQWQQQEGQYQTMLNMKMQLEARMSTLRQEREHLRALIELAEAKKVANRAVKSLDSLSVVGDDQVSNLAEQIRRRIDTEDARLDMATRKLSSEINDIVRGGEVERQLDERRRRLLGSQGGNESTSTESSGGSSESSSSS